MAISSLMEDELKLQNGSLSIKHRSATVIRSLRSQLPAKGETVSVLKSENGHLRNQLTEAVHLSEKLEMELVRYKQLTVRSSDETLQTEIDRLREDLVESVARSSTLEQDLRLMSDSSIHKSVLRKVKADVDILTTENTTLKVKLQNDIGYETLTTQVEDLQEQLIESVAATNTLNTELSIVNGDEGCLRRAIDSRNNMRATIEKQRDEIINLSTEVSKLRISQLSPQSNNVQEETLQTEVDNLREQLVMSVAAEQELALSLNFEHPQENPRHATASALLQKTVTDLRGKLALESERFAILERETCTEIENLRNQITDGSFTDAVQDKIQMLEDQLFFERAKWSSEVHKFGESALTGSDKVVATLTAQVDQLQEELIEATAAITSLKLEAPEADVQKQLLDIRQSSQKVVSSLREELAFEKAKTAARRMLSGVLLLLF